MMRKRKGGGPEKVSFKPWNLTKWSGGKENGGERRGAKRAAFKSVVGIKEKTATHFRQEDAYFLLANTVLRE